MAYKTHPKRIFHTLLLLTFGGIVLSLFLINIHPIIIKSPSKLFPTPTPSPILGEQVAFFSRENGIDAYHIYNTQTKIDKKIYQEPSHGEIITQQLLSLNKVYEATSLDYRKISLTTGKVIIIGNVSFTPTEIHTWLPNEHRVATSEALIRSSPIASSSPTGLITLYTPPKPYADTYQFSVTNNESRSNFVATVPDNAKLVPFPIGWSQDENHYYFSFTDPLHFFSGARIYDLSVQTRKIVPFVLASTISALQSVTLNTSQDMLYLQTAKGLYRQPLTGHETMLSPLATDSARQLHTIIFSHNPTDTLIAYTLGKELRVANPLTGQETIIATQSASRRISSYQVKGTLVAYLQTDTRTNSLTGIIHHVTTGIDTSFLSVDSTSKKQFNLLGFIDQ